MHVLLTNDDGYDAPGLRALVESVNVLGIGATVVAPASPMSGASRSRRSAVPARWAWSDQIGDVRVIRVDSTPAACVIFGLTSGLLPPVDLCLSGVNAGENVGAGLPVSGTFGAVLEAAAFGVRGIALSKEFGGPWTEPDTWDWSWVSDAAARLVKTLLSNPSGWLAANVNLSNTDQGLNPAYTRVSRSSYLKDSYDLGNNTIVSVIDYAAEELAPDDDIRALAEDRRTSITLFPPT